MDEKSKLIFYPDWYMVVSGLDDATRLKIYDELLAYKFNKTPPTMPIVKLMASQIDRDEETYENICNRNKWNGAKGGRPKKPNGFEENPNNPVGFLETQENPNNPNEPNNKEKDKDKDKDKDKEKENPPIGGGKESEDISASKDAPLSKAKKEFYDELIPYVSIYGKEMIRDFYDYWTEENKSRTKFRKQLERTWDTNRRLRTWASKSYGDNINNRTNRALNGNATNNHHQGVTRSEITKLVNQFLNETD